MVSAALKTLARAAAGFDGPNVVDGEPGFVVLPGGWADEEGNWYFVALVIERDAEGVKAAEEGDGLVGTCRVAVCNNPGGDGTAWHGATAEAPPKMKHRVPSPSTAFASPASSTTASSRCCMA